MKSNKYSILVFFFVALFLSSCFSREIVTTGDGSPKHKKFIGGYVKNLTTSDESYFYPEFDIIVEKKTEYTILEYEIHYIYVFGQDTNVYLDVRKRYTQADPEIQELNEKGQFVIHHKLDKIPREKVYDPSSYLGELNYNSVDAQDCYVKVSTSRKKRN
jgi:hypothetical protein